MMTIRFAIIVSATFAWAGNARAGEGELAASRAATAEAARPHSDDVQRPEDIVVTADRYGEAKVAAEAEFGEDEIASYGADSISGLIDRLKPFIDGTGDEPLILVNGQPVGFDRAILSYPSEALNRVAILRPEAASQYGQRPGRRVVNLVLKKKFASRTVDVAGEWATAGGQYGGSLSVGQVAIDGPTRWNVQGRVTADSALYKRSRDVPARSGPIDTVGYILGPDGTEIDPALSLAAGEAVTAAAIPSGALAGAPALTDFVATANRLHPADPAGFETLRPLRRNLSFTLGVSRPLGPLSASLNLNANANRSNSLRGIEMTSIILPSGSRWSPFAQDVALVRALAGDRALRSENSSKSFGAALTLSGPVGGWQSNFSFNYTRNWSGNLFGRGIDTGRIQALVDGDDPSFNPFGPWSERLLLAERSRSRGENMATRINLTKPAIDLPAGPLTVNISGGASHNRSRDWRRDNLGTLVAVGTRKRAQANGQITLGIPITRRGEGRIGRLGDMAAELSVGAQAASSSRPQKQYGGALTWSPFARLQLRGTFDREELVPSFDQLDGPRLETIVRTYDFARGEVAEPVWTTGGNPDLGQGSRQSLSLNAMVQPLGSPALTVNVGYRRTKAAGAAASFPDLTPAVEAAFPDRVTRDGAGRLIAIDARAINVAHDIDEDMTSSIALRLPDVGKARQQAAPPKIADPWLVGLSLNHRWRLRSEFLIRPGLPPIDRIRDGGQSRHFLSLQLTAGKRGVGASLNGSWSGAARIRNGGASQDYRYKPPIMVNLGLFVEPAHVFADAKGRGWLKDVKISLDVRNLLNGYRRVTLDDGSVPAGATRDEIDPLGRTVKLSVRKRI